MKDDNHDNVVHIVFNPSKQTEADSITFSIEELMEYNKYELKPYVEDFLALGYDEFTAFKLAREICYPKNSQH